MHSTGANNPYLHRYVGPDDGLLGPNPYGNHSNQPGTDVCASAYIGKLQDGTVAVYQTLPWDMRCWLSGSGPNGNANRLGYIGFEICEDKLADETYFEAVMEQAALLTAYLCQEWGISPWDTVKETPSGLALAVMDHAELHAVGLASNHRDIGHWLKRFGSSMNAFRGDVDAILREGVQATYIDAKEAETVNYPTLRRGDSGEDVKKLQEMLLSVGCALGSTGADGSYGTKTENAVKAFQKITGLKVDGVAGPKTWAALEKVSDAQAEIYTGEDVNSPDYVTMSKADFAAIKASYATMGSIIRKYE